MIENLQKITSRDFRQEEKDNIIKKVIEMQKNCSSYVTEQSSELLSDLYDKNLLKIGKNEKSEIVATFYEQPLDPSMQFNDVNQIFRIGGLATFFSPDSKKVVIRILDDFKKEILQKNLNIMAKTDNPVLSRYLSRLGMEELTFEECKDKYPDFINFYVEKSLKDEKEYFGKKFYIRKALKKL